VTGALPAPAELAGGPLVVSTVGMAVIDIWAAMARVLDSHGGDATGIGRLGHAIGLSLTEWPSIARDADTTLVPGMVLAVEPGLAYGPAPGQDHPRLMVQEENIVITAGGAQLLSRRGPAEIPIVH
jgi:Xaa-Pro aminopeptidase